MMMSLTLLRKYGIRNKANYNKMKELMLKKDVDEYYVQFHGKNKKTTHKKIRHDFASSIANIPGSALGKRKSERNTFQRPSRKKMNETSAVNTYSRPLDTKVYISNQRASAASLSTNNTFIENSALKPSAKVVLKDPRASQLSKHRFQFKRVNKLKYNN